MIETPATARRLYPRARDRPPPNALQILAALYAHPAADPARLGEMLALNKSAVSEALADLRERGLIKEQRVASDRRRSTRELTPAGVAEADKLIALTRTIIDGA